MRKAENLADVINTKRTGKSLHKALTFNWQWQSYERPEAAYRNVSQKHLSKKERADRFGLKLNFPDQ